MKKKLRHLVNNNSKYLLSLCVVEIVLAIVITLSYVYTDSLNYEASLVYQQLGVQTLLENLYSSSFWALILVLMDLIVVMTVTSLVYHKMEYHFMSILIWFMLLVLSLNFTKPVGELIATCALFIPIIIINVICFNKQKEKLQELKDKKKKKVSKK